MHSSVMLKERKKDSNKGRKKGVGDLGQALRWIPIKNYGCR